MPSSPLGTWPSTNSFSFASQAILKEEWLEPIEFVARADRRRELAETMQQSTARQRALFDRLRLPLLTGAIPAAIKLETGQLVEIPAYFWQSDGAFRAFAKQEATVDDGHALQRQGRVLFKNAHRRLPQAVRF